MWSESLCQRVAQRANYVRPYSAVFNSAENHPFFPGCLFPLPGFFFFRTESPKFPSFLPRAKYSPWAYAMRPHCWRFSLPLLSRKRSSTVHAGDLCLKDGVCSQFFRVGDTALQADGTLGDHGRTYGLRLLWGEVALCELVHVSAAAHAAEIRGFHHGGGGEIDDELAGFPDEVVGIPGGSDGNIGHGRMGRQNACPGDGEDVGMLHRAAGDQGRRYGC